MCILQDNSDSIIFSENWNLEVWTVSNIVLKKIVNATPPKLLNTRICVVKDKSINVHVIFLVVLTLL